MLCLQVWLVYAGAMRTNVTLDEDVYAQVTVYASAKNLSLGKALSELVRKANDAPPPPSRLVRGPHGLPMMPSRGIGKVITQEKIDQAREEGYFG